MLPFSIYFSNVLRSRCFTCNIHNAAAHTTLYKRGHCTCMFFFLPSFGSRRLAESWALQIYGLVLLLLSHHYIFSCLHDEPLWKKNINELYQGCICFSSILFFFGWFFCRQKITTQKIFPSEAARIYECAKGLWLLYVYCHSLSKY